MPFVVGLTGGIGSGKSTAAEEFARLGATIVDADAIAHELTGKGGAALPEIRKAFGEALVDAKSGMDRKKMRQQVFEDPDAKKRLESLLHPLIREEAQRRIATASGPYVVHVVPLLVESGDPRKRADRVLVVDCPEEMQVARAIRRGNLDETEARAIVRSQASREARLAAADDVIHNAGTIEALRAQVAALHARYLTLAKERSA
jgi:dephospho-CoA kinase